MFTKLSMKKTFQEKWFEIATISKESKGILDVTWMRSYGLGWLVPKDPRRKAYHSIFPLVSACIVSTFSFPSAADALLNSPNRLLPRSVDAALRRSIPAVNPVMEDVQNKIEKIAFLLRIPQRKPYGSMRDDVDYVINLVRERPEDVMRGIPSEDNEENVRLLQQLNDTLGKLLVAVDRRDPDRVSIAVANVLETIADIEVLQAPGLPFTLPLQYADYPRLTGRATVRFTVERKQTGGDFVVAQGGGGKKTARIDVVVDGYSAPITAGAFVSNVEAGKYDGTSLSRNGTTLLSSVSTEDLGSIPLELKPTDSFEPLYRIPLDVQDGELPTLPLSLYGAVAMVHSDPDSYSSSSSERFFIYLFDPQQSGLSGLSFEEGQFAVFGYVTDGREVLSQLQNGDRLVKAEVIKGSEKLLIPPRKEVYPELN